MNMITEFFNKHGNDILKGLGQHVYLTVLAMVIVIAIALPLGIFLSHTRRQRLADTIMSLASVVQTIPSLALIAFIMVVFILLHLPSIGILPAITTLILYALLPILRNTYAGIRQVDPTIIEVAVGMGMTPMQVLWRVELPLALPVIMAGIRTATVWTIGVATLCTLIGAGGLGDLIMRGLVSTQPDYLIAGTVPAGLLALLLDWILARVESYLTPSGMAEE